MSKGPGHVERTIHDLIEQAPDGAWTVSDLSHAVYGIWEPEKKHRVSIKRTMKRVCADSKWVTRLISPRLYSQPQLVLYDPCNVISYVVATEGCYPYGYPGRPGHNWRDAFEPPNDDPDDDAGHDYDKIQPGSAAWGAVQINIARRDDDYDVLLPHLRKQREHAVKYLALTSTQRAEEELAKIDADIAAVEAKLASRARARHPDAPPRALLRRL